MTLANIYEEMMQNIELACLTMFKKLDIPTEFVSNAKAAFDKHSQNELFGSSSLNKENLISLEEMVKINQLFELFQIPINVDISIEKFSTTVH